MSYRQETLPQISGYIQEQKVKPELILLTKNKTKTDRINRNYQKFNCPPAQNVKLCQERQHNTDFLQNITYNVLHKIKSTRYAKKVGNVTHNN